LWLKAAQIVALKGAKEKDEDFGPLIFYS